MKLFMKIIPYDQLLGDTQCFFSFQRDFNLNKLSVILIRILNWNSIYLIPSGTVLEFVLRIWSASELNLNRLSMIPLLTLIDWNGNRLPWFHFIHNWIEIECHSTITSMYFLNSQYNWYSKFLFIPKRFQFEQVISDSYSYSKLWFYLIPNGTVVEYCSTSIVLLWSTAFVSHSIKMFFIPK
jgi:hypothetical protein